MLADYVRRYKKMKLFRAERRENKDQNISKFPPQNPTMSNHNLFQDNFHLETMKL